MSQAPTAMGTTDQSPPPGGHLALLDLARGVSAQLVVVGHLGVLAFPGLWAQRLPDGRLGARTDLFQVQSFAVVIFLVLSGYVIARSVRSRVRQNTFRLGGYLLDRGARILTPLLPLIPVIVIVDRLVLGPTLWSRFVVVRHDVATVVSNLLLLQDNAVMRGLDAAVQVDWSRRSLGSAAPWWTVGYEWWIYLFFGCVLAVTVSKLRGWWRLGVYALGGFAGLSVFGFAAGGNCLGLAWLIGFAVAWWETRLTADRVLVSLAGVGGVVAAASALLLDPGNAFSPVVVVGSAVALMSVHQLRLAMPAGLSGAATFLAKYSYSLYLTHFSVLIWIVAARPTLQGVPLLLGGFGAANVGALAWWWLTERHYGRVRSALRSRWGV